MGVPLLPTPLLGHGFSHAGQGGTSDLPAVISGEEVVLTTICLISPAHDSACFTWPLNKSPWLEGCGAQGWEAPEPEAGGFARVLTKLMWLNDLSGWDDS